MTAHMCWSCEFTPGSCLGNAMRRGVSSGDGISLLALISGGSLSSAPHKADLCWVFSLPVPPPLHVDSVNGEQNQHKYQVHSTSSWHVESYGKRDFTWHNLFPWTHNKHKHHTWTTTPVFLMSVRDSVLWAMGFWEAWVWKERNRWKNWNRNTLSHQRSL